LWSCRPLTAVTATVLESLWSHGRVTNGMRAAAHTAEQGTMPSQVWVAEPAVLGNGPPNL
jgi:hypothetical protein